MKLAESFCLILIQVRRADFTITLRHENDVLAELKNEIRKTIEEHERQIQDLQTGKVSRDEFKEVMRSIEAKNVEVMLYVNLKMMQCYAINQPIGHFTF